MTQEMQTLIKLADETKGQGFFVVKNLSKDARSLMSGRGFSLREIKEGIRIVHPFCPECMSTNVEVIERRLVCHKCQNIR